MNPQHQPIFDGSRPAVLFIPINRLRVEESEIRRSKECLYFFPSVILSVIFFLPSPALAQQGRNTIEGRITNSENRPVENVRVFLTAEGPIAQTITDGSGRYQFRRLRRGIYYVEVEPGGTGYARQSQRVEINPPDLAGTGGADFYRSDFVLKPDRSGRADSEGGSRSIKSALFYQDIPPPAKDAYKQAVQSWRKTISVKLRSP